ATIHPKKTKMKHLTQADENTLIQLNNMQLNRFELGATFASEAIDEYDGFRVLESCDSGISIFLQTSMFADFKSLIVPQSMGSVTGVYSRDFGDDFNVLIMNSAADIIFDETNRCDPMELSCGLATTLGTGSLFYEDFESQRNNQLIVGNGWTNYIEAGSVGWEAFSSTSSNAALGRSARCQSARSGDERTVGWVVIA